MNSRRTYVALSLLIVMIVSLSWAAMAQEKASPQEITQKVKEAASIVAKSGEAGVGQFNTKAEPWVWKDTYIFVLDCAKGIMAAHPMKPELVGKDVLAMKDPKRNAFFAQLCGASKIPAGVWVEYWWPKPGAQEPARKVSYAVPAGNTVYVVAAGIYDDKTTIGELEKMK